jgi:hypothetical protein
MLTLTLWYNDKVADDDWKNTSSNHNFNTSTLNQVIGLANENFDRECIYEVRIVNDLGTILYHRVKGA